MFRNGIGWKAPRWLGAWWLTVWFRWRPFVEICSRSRKRAFRFTPFRWTLLYHRTSFWRAGEGRPHRKRCVEIGPFWYRGSTVQAEPGSRGTFRRWIRRRGWHVDDYWGDGHVPKWAILAYGKQTYSPRWYIALDLRYWLRLKAWTVTPWRTPYNRRKWYAGWNIIVGPIHLQHRAEFKGPVNYPADRIGTMNA